MRFILPFLLLPGLAFAAPAAIRVESPTLRPTYGRTAVGAGYVTLYNPQDKEDRLTGADTPMARRVELHTTETKGDIMRMRHLPDMAVPAQGTLVLSPGQSHLMFFDLAEPFTAGMRVPVTLHFETAGDVTAEFVVK